MFKSEVTLLKNENAKELVKLGDDSTYVINNIMKSMSIFKVNSYDAQVIRRDLIGMAQELELRGSNLEISIGDDIEQFTAEIMNNSIGPSKIEILLGFLIKASNIFFLTFILLSFGAYSSLNWDANPIIFIFYIGVTIITFITDVIITPLYSVKKGIKKYIPLMFSIISFLSLTAITYLLNDNENTIRIYGGWIIGISGLSYVIFNYLNIKNVSRLSEGKKNHIADLIEK